MICLFHKWRQSDDADNVRECNKCCRREYYSPYTNFKWVRY